MNQTSETDDVLARARALQKKDASEKTVIISLLFLQDLIAEIEVLRAIVSARRKRNER